MKNKDLKKLTTSMIEPLFEVFEKEIPPTAILLSENNGPVCMQFTDLQNKDEVAASIFTTAAMLDDVLAVVWLSESWGVEVSDQKIIKRFNGDAGKINQWLKKQYPSLEDCPYKKELLMIMVDDGDTPFFAQIDMKRDGDKNLSWEQIQLDDYIDQPSYKQADFHGTFNHLLAKAEILKSLMAESHRIPVDMRPDEQRVWEIVLHSLAIKNNYDIPHIEVVERCYSLAQSVNNRQVPPGATKH